MFVYGLKLVETALFAVTLGLVILGLALGLVTLVASMTPFEVDVGSSAVCLLLAGSTVQSFNGVSSCCIPNGPVCETCPRVAPVKTLDPDRIEINSNATPKLRISLLLILLIKINN